MFGRLAGATTTVSRNLLSSTYYVMKCFCPHEVAVPGTLGTAADRGSCSQAYI